MPEFSSRGAGQGIPTSRDQEVTVPVGWPIEYASVRAACLDLFFGDFPNLLHVPLCLPLPADDFGFRGIIPEVGKNPGPWGELDLQSRQGSRPFSFWQYPALKVPGAFQGIIRQGSGNEDGMKLGQITFAQKELEFGYCPEFG